MPRPPRPDLAGIPQHVIQRGNNRQACFFRESDYGYYKALLRRASIECDCTVHAYVLMTNHVHLLVTPQTAGGVSRMMQSVGRSYVGGINARYQRTGTLWEGRFKSCLVDSDEYLLACYRYIELNPVRANMTPRPEDYRWSSCRANSLGVSDPLIGSHASYDALGPNPPARRSAYRAFLSAAIPDALLEEIRSTIRQQKVLGKAGFRRQVETTLDRCMDVRPAHRPRVHCA